MRNTNDSQKNVIIKAIKKGRKINRVMFGWIPDFRSRICDAQKELGVRFDRNTKAGKRYKEYFLSQYVKARS